MNKSGVADQVISLPTGGGAIKGLGESFSPDLHTGTGNLSVPIAVPGGRGGLQPELVLAYSTGNGNGAFGLGWSLNVPGVSRDTSKRLPTYDDSQDIFLISGAEQLVPVSSASTGTTVYRPRTEGIFSRLTHFESGQTDYWQARSRNGLVSVYGDTNPVSTSSPIVSSPDGTHRIFSWYLSQTRDPFGNLVEYVYQREPNRIDGPHHWDQVYLKTVRYGDYGAPGNIQFMVSIDFTYEDRPDPFSTYKAGFEIRTTQRCKQIQISTNSGVIQLAKTYQLTYQEESNPALAPANAMSLLSSIQVQGVDGAAVEILPTLDFGYTAFDPTRRHYRSMSGIANSLPERSLANPDYELADLFGRGLPDVVQIGDTTRYWRNLGNGAFDIPRPIERLPSGIRLGDPGVQLADADGDGHIDLLLSAGRVNGYVPLTVSGKEATGSFVQYAYAPPFALNDPQARLIDLDGDGITDVLRTGPRFELYFNDRAQGWNRSETRTRGDLTDFPNVQFSDGRVKLADMTGDGLQDIVFVSPGSVVYWPYMGNGRWGQRVTMGGTIRFPDGQSIPGVGYDPARLLLGDMDGDGVSDMVYVESGRLTLWINQNGNRWSEPIVIQGTPPVTNSDAIRLVDMLGNGTQGILWTYDPLTFGDSSYKFLDLTGGVKPYLLNQKNNNTGATTLIEYVPSTQFFLLDDVLPKTRWKARLPFPVQVVSRVEVIDAISGGKLSTEYSYHQGYWDGDEREFRGFGIVEQFDSEAFEDYQAQASNQFAGVDPIHFSPPTLTRTWFHQGQVQNSIGVWSEPDYATSAWTGDPSMFGPEQRVELGAIAIESAQHADPTQLRHALRALRGSVLRSELYAVDGSPNQDHPYTVTESQFDVREIDPPTQGSSRLRIFFPFQIANRTSQWERGAEPMIRCEFTGNYDAYGMPGSKHEIAVPRGRNPLVQLASPGTPYLSTYSTTEYARLDNASLYIIDRTCRANLTEVLNDGTLSVFGLRDMVASGGASLRVIGHARTFYDGDAFIGLPLGVLGQFGAPVRSESLVFEDDFLTKTFDPTDPLAVSGLPVYLNPEGVSAWPLEYPAEFTSLLPSLAGYVHYGTTDVTGSPGGYYVTDSRRSYDFHDPAQTPRGLALISRDPLGADTTVAYDSFDLLPVSVIDPVGLTSLATYDYRVLQAQQVTDINGNVAGFAFSPSGLLTAQTVQGKNGEGDSTHPSVTMEYDLLAFTESGQPISVRTTKRVHHDSETDVPAANRDDVLVSVQYSDGFGRLIQTRIQAEDTLFGDPALGGGVISVDQSVAVSATAGQTRAATDPDNVVVSGWQVYDNKGHVVEKFEPFFDKGYDFSAPAANQLGQKITIFYDPRGQAIRTVNPDSSEQRILFGVPIDIANPDTYTPTPWESYVYDPNDNAGRTAGSGANAYSSHWNTPSSIVLDPLGRTVSATARNGQDPTKDWYTTQSSYDIQGNLISVTDALGRVAFQYAFDIAKRRWRMDSIDAGRRDTVLDVLGNPSEGRDSKGALSLQGYDVLHRPIRLWTRDNTSGPVTLRQRMDYGDGGAVDQPVADRAAARAQNLLGQLTRHHDEAGLSVLTAVDFKRNILDKSRTVIADAPMLKIFDQAAAQEWNIVPFQVDWTPASTQTLSDLEGELLETTAYQTTASYDALNRIKSMQFPLDVEGERRELVPQYNRAGGLEQVSLDGTLYVERIAYDAKGQRALIAYANGVMTRYAYDPQTFRLARLRSEHYTEAVAGTYSPTGDPLQDFDYDYDLVGNILGIRDRTPGSGFLNNPAAASTSDPVLAQLLIKGDALNRVFAYDPIYRLLSASGRECDQASATTPWLDDPRRTDLTKARSYTENYTYDAAGSLLQLQHQNVTGTAFNRVYNLETVNNRMTSMQIGQTAFAYTFDVNGNMLSETTARHFDWNYADQMKVFRTQTDGAEPSVYAQYLYDLAGRRVKKLVRNQGGQTEVTHYIDGAFEHHRWTDGTQTLENNYQHVMDDKQRIALIRIGTAQSGDTSPAVQYQLADHLGSSNVVVDATGAFFNREEFTPYGETSFGSFAKKRYRFTGMERDEESGLSYHVARYYLHWIGRWASCDPLQSTNRYFYCAGNPATQVDTKGREPTQSGTNSSPAANGAASSDVGAYRHVAGDHIHQVASRTNAPGAKRTSAPMYRGALSKSTKDPTYDDKAGQRAERNFNRAMWGKDFNESETAPSDQTCKIDSAGNSDVGVSRAATPSPWADNQKSFGKVRAAGTPPDEAWDWVNRSGEELNSAGATPKRVPDAPRSVPRNLQQGQRLSPEGPLRTMLDQLPPEPETPPYVSRQGFNPAEEPTIGNGIAVIALSLAPTLAQNAARALGASDQVTEAVGFGASVFAGAGWGALAGLPADGIGAIPGAVIGGVIGGVGYLSSNYELCVPFYSCK